MTALISMWWAHPVKIENQPRISQPTITGRTIVMRAIWMVSSAVLTVGCSRVKLAAGQFQSHQMSVQDQKWA